MLTYKGIEIVDATSDDEFADGNYYLVKVSKDTGAEHYQLRSDPPRTNASNERRVSGWCGSTNGTSVFGCGCVRVRRDDHGHVRIAAIDPDVMAAASATDE